MPEIWELEGEALLRALREQAERNAQLAREDWQRRLREREMRRLQKSGMGDRLLDKEFLAFSLQGVSRETRAAYDVCFDFAHNIGRQTKGLMLSGSPGTGKTHLAAAVNCYLTAQFYPVVYGNITNIISSFKQSYGGRTMTEFELLAELDKPKLLIIDDLGKENPTQNTVSLIYQIVNRRYERGGLLMVTTNLTSNEMRQRLGEALVSRLAEMCRPFTLIGQDRRLLRAEG